MAPSQSTGAAFSRAEKSPAIFLRIQEEQPTCIAPGGTGGQNLTYGSDIIRSFASNSLYFNALRSPWLKRTLIFLAVSVLVSAGLVSCSNYNSSNNQQRRSGLKFRAF